MKAAEAEKHSKRLADIQAQLQEGASAVESLKLWQRSTAEVGPTSITVHKYIAIVHGDTSSTTYST